MYTAANAALLASAPFVPGILRPRYGSLPLLLFGLCFLWVLLLRYALPGFRRRATIAVSCLCIGLLLSFLPRAAGRSWGAAWLTPGYYHYIILPMTVVQVTMLLGVLSAPLWVPIGRLARRRLQALGPEPDLPPQAQALPSSAPSASRLITRRALLQAAPWIVPGGTLLGASYGSLIESRRVVVRRLRLPIVGLPAALSGFRIGQITDLHIARDLTQLRHLERGLELLAAERLDILCATGDLCDEPKLFAAMLRLLAQVPVRLGHYGCLGNHESFVGLDVVRRAYDRSAVQLLEDESIRLGALRLAGIGYAMRGRFARLWLPDVPAQLDVALQKRALTEPTLTVLLAHHPHVVTQLAGRNIALMLAGHTHGGQLGLGSGSAIEKFYPYARGLYQVPASPIWTPNSDAPPSSISPPTQLFVSSGLGHWLPARMNCPPEVVVIELVSA